MPPKKRASFVALSTLLRRRFPDLADPAEAITDGRVLVDGARITNTAARVRFNASVRVVNPKPLRGTRKLRGALEALRISVAGAVALDLGAAAGGFTQALLDAGACRVYAVDAGSGQLRGYLRTDNRVVNLEKTNLARVDSDLVRERVDLVTMDLSYLALADALPQLDLGLLAPGAQLVTLVKPTYELHAGTMAADPDSVAEAVASVRRAMVREGWHVVNAVPSSVTGSRGAAEVFVHAVRATLGTTRHEEPTYTHPTATPTLNDYDARG